MSHNDLLKQVKEQYIQGQISTPFIIVVSEEEQRANAELTRQKAQTEKENRRWCIVRRYCFGILAGFILGSIFWIIFFNI